MNFNLHIDQNNPLKELLEKYLLALLQNDRHEASTLILDAVKTGTTIKDIYLYVFQPSQYEIGRLWQYNKITVAQEHFCTAATQLVMSQLYPFIFKTEKNGYKLVATCIGGELHEIGIRMVSDFFEMDGWDTYYLGANTPTDSIISTIESTEANVLAISASMFFHIDSIKQLIQNVKSTIDNTKLKVIAGGRPFVTQNKLWKEVHADGNGKDAQEAIQTARSLVGL